MNADTKTALARLEAAIAALETRHAEPDAGGAAVTPDMKAEISAIRKMIDEAIEMIEDDSTGGAGDQAGSTGGAAS